MFALTMALAVTLASSTAFADTFDYAFNGNDGVVATGTLTGNLAAPGAFLITSGTIDLTGAFPGLDGTGVLVPDSGTGVFQTGGGTELILDESESLLYPSNGQLIDNSGVFLFQMTSGLGAGLFSNEPNGPGYGMFGGNWNLNDSGALTVTSEPAAVTPEPSSLILAGSGMMILAGFARRHLARV